MFIRQIPCGVTVVTVVPAGGVQDEDVDLPSTQDATPPTDHDRYGLLTSYDI